MPKVTPRRPYVDDKPDGYLESDNDFMENNADACCWFLANAEAIRNRLFLQPSVATLPIEEIKSKLCCYDPENPNNNLDAYDDEERPKARENCSCDNCFYGRDKLAVCLLSVLQNQQTTCSLITDLAASLNAFVEDESFRAKGSPNEPRFQTPGWFARMDKARHALAQATLFLPKDQKSSS
jgi:hypothetical protein